MLFAILEGLPLPAQHTIDESQRPQHPEFSQEEHELSGQTDHHGQEIRQKVGGCLFIKILLLQLFIDHFLDNTLNQISRHWLHYY